MDNFGTNLFRQLNSEFNGKSPVEVEAVQNAVESKFDIFRDSELKKYLHLVPYIFVLVQVILTGKVPIRNREIRLLILTLIFHSLEITSEIIKITSYFSWTTNYNVSLDCDIIQDFSFWLKFITLIFIILAEKFFEEKKLAHRRRVPFDFLRIFHFNSLDTWIIVTTLLLNFFYPFRNLPITWGTILSIRAAIDLIECGTLLANFRLQGCDIDKNDMIGFGLTILANTYDYKSRSIFPISFAVYYIGIGLFDKLRNWIEVLHVRVPAGLEAPKIDFVENGVVGDVLFAGLQNQFVDEDEYLDLYGQAGL